MDAKIPIIWHPGSTYLNVVSQTTHISMTNRNACLFIFLLFRFPAKLPTIVLNHCIAWHVILFHSVIQFEWGAAGNRYPGEMSAGWINEYWLPSSVYCLCCTPEDGGNALAVLVLMGDIGHLKDQFTQMSKYLKWYVLTEILFCHP